MLQNTDSAPLVVARGLTKTFDGKTAVDHVDFEIRPGEIVGFLGPNGAGKTTTIRMLLNVLRPNAGELRIFGETFEGHRASILTRMNASSGTLTLPGKLSVIENLKVFGDMYAVPDVHRRIGQLLERFDLIELGDRPLYALSTGQQVRVSLAKAFLNRPRLLLLDEPTSSLDPDVAGRVRALLVSAVREEGTTVFVTSHNMLEVERTCSRVLFLNEGRIQAEGSPQELAQRLRQWTIRLRARAALPPATGLNVPADTRTREEDGDTIIEIDRDHVGSYLTQIVQKGAEIESVSIREPSLEDFFVHSARQQAPNE